MRSKFIKMGSLETPVLVTWSEEISAFYPHNRGIGQVQIRMMMAWMMIFHRYLPGFGNCSCTSKWGPPKKITTRFTLFKPFWSSSSTSPKKITTRARFTLFKPFWCRLSSTMNRLIRTVMMTANVSTISDPAQNLQAFNTIRSLMMMMMISPSSPSLTACVAQHSGELVGKLHKMSPLS